MEAIEVGSLGECFVQMEIGSDDCLALQSLPIPEGSTNITIPAWLFPHHFPASKLSESNKQRLTACHPDDKRENIPAYPRHAL